jgi:hypothetical protein
VCVARDGARCEPELRLAGDRVPPRARQAVSSTASLRSAAAPLLTFRGRLFCVDKRPHLIA